MIAIVSGMIATYPVGGVFWDYAQYILGLEQLGFDVYYIEDTGCPTYDPIQSHESEDFSYGVHFLNESLSWLNPKFKSRWHFREMYGKQSRGLSKEKFEEIIAESDLFLNVSGCCLLRESYLKARRKVIIDTDPGYNHFLIYPKWIKNPIAWDGSRGLLAHDYFFTYAENINNPDCLLPTFDIDWHVTRPPINTDPWKTCVQGEKWTTVMSWNNYRKELQYQEKTFGSKEKEFPKFENLPQKINVSFEIASGGHNVPRDHWRSLGWSVVDSELISKTPEKYRSYIQSSRAEFSVAKNVYVATNSGWFSCRSVCYMAAGLPVVLQDTGFSKFISTGQGVLAFSTLDEAIANINEVENNYMSHSTAARKIVEEYFSAKIVLQDILNKIGLGLEYEYQ